MSDKKREFTGVWIPAHIIEDETLTPLEKMLFAEISCFKRCFVSNAGFAKRLGITESWVQKNLKKLKDKGYIRQVAFDGRSRTLIVVYDEQGRGGQSEVSAIDNRTTIDNIENTVLRSSENSLSNSKSVSFGAVSNSSPDTAPALDPNAPPTALKLMCDVVKMYGLPTTNFNHIRKWSSELDKMDDGKDYLQNLLDNDIREAEGQFRPTLNVPYDIITKKLKIQRFLNGGEDSKPYDPRVGSF